MADRGIYFVYTEKEIHCKGVKYVVYIRQNGPCASYTNNHELYYVKLIFTCNITAILAI